MTAATTPPATPDPKLKTTTIITYLKVTKEVKGEVTASEIEQIFAKARSMREQLKDQGTIEGHVSVGKQAYRL